MGICASAAPGAVAPDAPNGHGGVTDDAPLDPATMPAELNAKYDWGKQIGTGMSGKVYLCSRKTDGKTFAIKCCGTTGLTKDDLSSLRQEVALLKKVKHPNILEYVEHVEAKDMIYIVTDLISGGELFDAIIERKTYTEADAKQVVTTLLFVLEYLHDAGIVHRDLKPENLMLVDKSHDAAIKVVDFGLASEVGDDAYGGITVGAGTPGYLAPECTVRDPNYGKPSDVWAMGVVAYVLLCGYPPFYGDNDEELYTAIRNGDWEFDPEEWDIVSPYAKDFIKQVFTPSPFKRPNVKALMEHPWIKETVAKSVDLQRTRTKLKEFQAKRRFKKAVSGVIFSRRLNMLLSGAKAAAGEEKGDAGEGGGGGASST
jgi:serine/threonine protein kinase